MRVLATLLLGLVVGTSGSGASVSASDDAATYYGPEFTAHLMRNWLRDLEVSTLFIEPGSPWENGHNESFNARLRDELLDGELFYTLAEVRVVIERWRRHYNHVRPHRALGWRPPAPLALAPARPPPHYESTNIRPGATLGG